MYGQEYHEWKEKARFVDPAKWYLSERTGIGGKLGSIKVAAKKAEDEWNQRVPEAIRGAFKNEDARCPVCLSRLCLHLTKT